MQRGNKNNMKNRRKIPTRRRKIWSRNRKKNYDAVETSKNLDVSQKSSTRSTSDSSPVLYMYNDYSDIHNDVNDSALNCAMT